jgi:hypothetical protein
MTCEHCDKPVFSRRMCKAHYNRVWRHGSPDRKRSTPQGRVVSHERMTADIELMIRRGATPRNLPTNKGLQLP